MRVLLSFGIKGEKVGKDIPIEDEETAAKIAAQTAWTYGRETNTPEDFILKPNEPYKCWWSSSHYVSVDYERK